MGWAGSALAIVACVAIVGYVIRIPYDSILLVKEAKIRSGEAALESNLKRDTTEKVRIQSELHELHKKERSLEGQEAQVNSRYQEDKKEFQKLKHDLKQKHLADLNLQKTLDELKLEKDSNLIKAESDDLKRNTQHVASKRLKSALAANKVKFQSLRKRVYPKAGGAQRAIKLIDIKSNDCLPPRVLVDGVCLSDPEGMKPPAFCSDKNSAQCKEWMGNKEKLIDVYKKQLRDNYPYRYSEDEFSGDWHYTPGFSHKYRVIPQRYPHKDGSDLGDNYISGLSDNDFETREFDDAFVRSSASKTRTPIMLRPVTGFHDTDLTGRYQLEHLKPVVRSMDKGTLDLQHEIFGDDKYYDEPFYSKQYHPKVAAKVFNSEDRFRPLSAGKVQQEKKKLTVTGNLTPKESQLVFGNMGSEKWFKDDKMPAETVLEHHKNDFRNRKARGEPVSDALIAGWDMMNGVADP